MEAQNRRQESNLLMFCMGVYVRDALLCTVGNMFRKKGAKELTYPDRPYPFFEENGAGRELSEEEQRQKTQQLFDSLNIMKSNYELNH